MFRNEGHFFDCYIMFGHDHWLPSSLWEVTGKITGFYRFEQCKHTKTCLMRRCYKFNNGGGLILLEELTDANARRSVQPNNDAAATLKYRTEKEMKGDDIINSVLCREANWFHTLNTVEPFDFSEEAHFILAGWMPDVHILYFDLCDFIMHPSSSGFICYKNEISWWWMHWKMNDIYIYQDRRCSISISYFKHFLHWNIQIIKSVLDGKLDGETVLVDEGSESSKNWNRSSTSPISVLISSLFVFPFGFTRQISLNWLLDAGHAWKHSHLEICELVPSYITSLMLQSKQERIQTPVHLLLNVGVYLNTSLNTGKSH